MKKRDRKKRLRKRKERIEQQVGAVPDRTLPVQPPRDPDKS